MTKYSGKNAEIWINDELLAGSGVVGWEIETESEPTTKAPPIMLSGDTEITFSTFDGKLGEEFVNLAEGAPEIVYAPSDRWFMPRFHWNGGHLHADWSGGWGYELRVIGGESWVEWTHWYARPVYFLWKLWRKARRLTCRWRCC